jgi:hypothetical protein
MRKVIVWAAGFILLGLSGCTSMNVGLGGAVGDVNVGANVDALNKTVDANAAAEKTFSADGVDATVNTNVNEQGVGVDTQVQKDDE